MSLMDELNIHGLSAEDLEKAASVRLFEQDCAAENIDLNEMADDDIEQLYAHWLTLDEPGEKGAEAEPTAEEVDEATAKLAEAEYLGRHMARAFNDEAQKIASAESTKEAGPRLDKAKALWSGGKGTRVQQAKNLVQAGTHVAKTEGKAHVLRHPKKYLATGGVAAAGAGAAAGRASKGGSEKAAGAGDRVKGMLEAGKRHGQAAMHNAHMAVKDNPKKSIGAAAAGLGAAGFGAGRASKGEKKASFDSLVEQYASEILAENGLEIESETPSIDDIAYARAVELLQENGYSFEE